MKTEVFLLFLSLLFQSAVSQQCNVVVTSHVSLEKEILGSHNATSQGNITCSRISNAVVDELETRLEEKMDTLLETKLDTILETKLDRMLETKLDAMLETKLDTTLETKLDIMLETKLGALLETKLDTILVMKLDAMLKTKLNMTLGSIQETILNTHTSATQYLGTTLRHPAISCAEILQTNPNATSGYYWITGYPARHYCDMTRSCGGVTGGWMRVAHLDMTNSSQRCPSGLRQRTDFNQRTCTINSNSFGCSSVTFPVETAYGFSKVCGRIRAFQYGSPDAFSRRSKNLRIYRNYVDGVVLTVGKPRRHVWTFAAALDEVGTYPASICPCTNTNIAANASRPPSFVGDDYFCDTANAERYQNSFRQDDPLWDGAGCGPMNTCCSFNTPPWFYKQLSHSTTDDIEMRVCRDASVTYEDICIEKIDIYVQ